MDNKIEIFEVIVHKLRSWFMEQNSILNIEDFNRLNDFSFLKILKLHFLVTAINSDKDSALIDRFDFFAMPYGPVETEIYDRIKTNPRFSTFSIDNFKTVFFENNPNIIIASQLNEAIENGIQSLKEIDAFIIKADAGSLVDLTHKWSSWKRVYQEARSNNLYSKQIPKELIKKDNKLLNIELF